MAWIPSQDPWGIAMIASGAVFGISLVVVNARRMAIRPRTGPVMMTGLAASAFLACAAMGTLQRVTQGPDEPVAALEEPVADAAAPDTTTDPPSEDEADAPPPEAEDPSDDVPTPPARDSALEATPPLPSDDAARQTAIRKVLRSARSVYESQKDCKDAKAVGQAWAGVAAIPQDARSSRVKAVARKLEGCRKQVRWATAYNVHRERVAGRDDFEDTLEQRLRDAHDINASIALTGDNHQRIRVGSGGFDEALAAKIVSQALEDELSGLGFERIVLASSKKSWRTALEPRPEAEYVADALAPYGLDAKLTFSP